MRQIMNRGRMTIAQMLAYALLVGIARAGSEPFDSRVGDVQYRAPLRWQRRDLGPTVLYTPPYIPSGQRVGLAVWRELDVPSDLRLALGLARASLRSGAKVLYEEEVASARAGTCRFLTVVVGGVYFIRH
ncbi:MAG: hypothetical protein U0790_03730 [Isosphaeraceae bacterium]